jgi:hypothetical protein
MRGMPGNVLLVFSCGEEGGVLRHSFFGGTEGCILLYSGFPHPNS